MPPFSDLQHSMGDMPQYNGIQGIHHNVAHASGSPRQVFSGEVFAQEESAKFSDGTDSDSSRSSAQEQNTNGSNSCIPIQSNIRDPRHRTDHNTNYHGNRVEQRTENYERQRNHNKQGRNRYSEKQVSEINSSRRYAKDTKIPKERDVHIPSTHGISQSHHKSTSGEQAQKRRSVSKERESKSDTKLKDTADAERLKKEQEKIKPEIKGSRKSEETKLEKPQDRVSRERECSKSPKQYSSKTRDANRAGDKKGRTCDEKKDVKTESKTSETTSNNKNLNKNITDDQTIDINKVTPSKETPSNENSEMALDVRVRHGKEPEKRPNSDKEDTERAVKKPKLEIKEEPFPEGISDMDERVSNVDVTEEAMDVEAEPDVPTIDDDIR